MKGEWWEEEPKEYRECTGAESTSPPSPTKQTKHNTEPT